MGNYEILKRIPLVRLLIPFIAGIFIQHSINAPNSLLVPVCVLFLISLITGWFYFRAHLIFRFCWVYGVILTGFILVCSMCLTQRTLQVSSFIDHDGNGDIIVARIIESPTERDQWKRAVIEPFAVLEDGYLIKTKGKAIAWFEKDDSSTILSVGDQIIIPNKFVEIRNYGNPFEFDYRRFLRIQGIFGETYISKDEWIVFRQNERRTIISLAGRLREKLLSVLRQNGLDGREYAVAGALILGNRTDLDRDTKHIYATAGAMHILAVSGLHVGILYLVVNWVLGLLNGLRHHCYFRAVIVILVIWFYAILTGLSPSVTRSAIMFSFVSAAVILKGTPNILNTLASSAFIQLMINPLELYKVGFQLSYIAVTGIAIYYPFIYSSVKFNNPALSKVWALISVSLSAQILVFPLGIYYFNQFPNFFLLTSIIVVPLAMLILSTGLVLFIFSVIPGLAVYPAWLLKAELKLLNNTTEIISGLPFSYTSDLTIGIIQLIIIYGIIISLLQFIKFKKAYLLNLSLVFVITGLLVRADSKLNNTDRQMFIAYNTGNYSLFSFISGNSNFILSGRDSDTLKEEVPYAASGAALYMNTNLVKIVSFQDLFDDNLKLVPEYIVSRGGFVYFNGYRIFFAGKDLVVTHEVAEPVPVDLIVISGRFDFSITELLRMISPGQLVFDPSVPYYLKNEMIYHCDISNIKYHDVRSSGAFIHLIK
jgi:competence protein ComEC